MVRSVRERWWARYVVIVVVVAVAVWMERWVVMARLAKSEPGASGEGIGGGVADAGGTKRCGGSNAARRLQPHRQPQHTLSRDVH